MPALLTTGETRPNRLTSTKNKEYHRKYARWILGSINQSSHQDFITKSAVNWAFYKGNQWVFKEDLQAFLMDESGEGRNRIKFVENLIRPMVEQYVGNAIRLDFEAGVFSTSEFAVNRREAELARLMFLTRQANESEQFGEEMRNRLPIGETEEETEDIFENMYIDKYEKDIKNLITYVFEQNNLEEKKVLLAKHLSLDGIGILYCHEYNGEFLVEKQDPRYFIFDHSAQRPDLKDADYMGRYNFAMPTNIFERFQNISSGARRAIEEYSTKQSQSKGNSWMYGMAIPTDGRIPVYELYWRDIQTKEYGYVIDDFGYEFFTEINKEGGKYQDKHLIIPKSKAYRKILKGKKKRRVFVDLLRYCIFIPSEIVATEDNEDIILEYGVVPYQESDMFNPSTIEYPFKCYCWSYNNGEVLSPVDDTISPQRYLNRIQSIAEATVNNSRGSGTVFDSDMIDSQGGEDEIQRNMNLSKPVFVRAKGNLNNSIGAYDNTIGSGVANLYTIMSHIRQSIQNITGVNEAMQGTAGGKRRLVGVTQLDIQRGTLIQEPFYFALVQVLLQVAQAVATTGKRIYLDSNRRLAIITGDKGAERIRLSEGIRLEDFRVFVKRTSNTEQQKQAANQILFSLVGAGLIDAKRFANNFNRGNMDDISQAIREYNQELIEAAREKDKQERQGQSAEAGAIAGQLNLDQVVKDADVEREDRMKDRELERDVAKINAREIARSART